MRNYETDGESFRWIEKKKNKRIKKNFFFSLHDFYISLFLVKYE